MAEFLDSEPSRIKADGLRYKAKPGGSPFRSELAGNNLSCLLCGQRKPRVHGTFKPMFGARQFVCSACRPQKVVAEPAQKSAASLPLP